MNDDIQTKLRTLVERAVRPVRTLGCHKMRMREELLAHLTAIYEKELATNSNEELAYLRAAQRFGKVEELTEQLQGSVSRLQYLESFLQGPNSTEAATLRGAARYGLRVSLSVFVFNLALWTLLVPLMMLLGSSNMDYLLRFAVIWPLGLGVFMFGLFFLSLWTIRAASGRSWGQVTLIAALSILLVPITVVGVVAVTAFDLKVAWDSALPALPLDALLSPLVVFIMAWIFSRELSTNREWTDLAIE